MLTGRTRKTGGATKSARFACAPKKTVHSWLILCHVGGCWALLDFIFSMVTLFGPVEGRVCRRSVHEFIRAFADKPRGQSPVSSRIIIRNTSIQ